MKVSCSLHCSVFSFLSSGVSDVACGVKCGVIDVACSVTSMKYFLSLL